MITFTDVTKRYAGEDALHELNLTIKSHELFVLVGPSGSGKTTLLKMINRLNTPTSGVVAIDDVDVMQVPDVRQFRQHIGYVLQAGALFPNMTVAENAAVQLAPLGWSAAKQTERIRALLTQVGLEPELFMNRMPHELSGGEAQRVGIVRALVPNPNIVLMDEPFSALDPLSRRQLQELVVRLHREFDTTIIFVTHDMKEALKLADRLAVIHDGHLQQVGTPAEILAAPANEFVAEFFADEGAGATYLQHVVAAGFGNVTDVAAVVLAPTATIYDWAGVLQATPAQLIRVGATVLTPADLIAYMTTLTGGAK